MAGTRAGGIKAAATNKQRHGASFYAEIGKKGGKIGRTGGFAANPELAKKAGALGGHKSKRGKSLSKEERAIIAKQKERATELLDELEYLEMNNDGSKRMGKKIEKVKRKIYEL
jgi:general stress protein YciG